ncbi:hypothetical protein ASPCADRAFT_211119 [Aspergillus carbonarius ITEM 5010]|uniref:Phenazine biosynthesis-like protein n=1 Tax=Aspergillus carbonarius (strain ITEM 5010) TaxID=602072 RepID=A0A1R3R9Z7_ASPC5|nr:hypothetical protein ASPCADRAFT_211119 [Aspergillus carbonarius ITEM 5010]
MVNHLDFITLDVFTTRAYTGNPLAVVFLPDPSTTTTTTTTTITQHQKQTIAREFNLSETVFIHPRTGPHRRIDIFTPTDELPFAGHPTIGAASWFLCHSPDDDPIDRLITKSGEIPISVQAPSQPGTTPDPTTTVVARIAHNVHLHTARFPLQELLRLHGSLARFFPRAGTGTGEISFPVFSIVRGMNQILVELPSLEALGAVTTASGGEVVTTESGYLDDGWREGGLVVYFYVPGVVDERTGGEVIRTRFAKGNLEDPATGSAASGLAAYLALTERGEGVSRYSVVQGVEMRRRSEIGVEVAVNGEAGIEYLDLKGAAVKVSEGRVLVPPA